MTNHKAGECQQRKHWWEDVVSMVGCSIQCHAAKYILSESLFSALKSLLPDYKNTITLLSLFFNSKKQTNPPQSPKLALIVIQALVLKRTVKTYSVWITFVNRFLLCNLPFGRWRCVWRIQPEVQSLSVSLWCLHTLLSRRASSAHISPEMHLPLESFKNQHGQWDEKVKPK